MAVRLKFYDKEFERHMQKATAKGLQRAGVYLHGACQRAVNVSNPRNNKTGEYDQPSKPGEPPRARTGYGRSNIVYEYNGIESAPAVRVGVRKNALYMFWLEIGTRRIKPRPWLVATLMRFKAIIGRLATLP